MLNAVKQQNKQEMHNGQELIIVKNRQRNRKENINDHRIK